MLAGGIGYLARDRAARLRQTGQRVAESLAGARTAIEAGDLTLAGQRVAEAQGRLGADGASLPDLSAEIGGIRRESDARQADAARFDQFLKGASDAQDGWATARDLGGERVAEETLGLYGVLTEKDWSSRLESSYLTADQKQQVRETAYVTLVSLADFYVRWSWAPGHDPRGSREAWICCNVPQAFHQPTRAFYFVRGECRRRQGDTAAADEDEKRFKAADRANGLGLLSARTHGRLGRRPRRGHPLLPGGTPTAAEPFQLPVLPRHALQHGQDQSPARGHPALHRLHRPAT